MPGGTAIRGTNVGSQTSLEQGRNVLAERFQVSYWCRNGHCTQITYAHAEDVSVPDIVDCTHCGQRAGRDPKNPPQAQNTVPFKTHLAYVQERRSEADGAALLAEALENLRRRQPGAAKN